MPLGPRVHDPGYGQPLEKKRGEYNRVIHAGQSLRQRNQLLSKSRSQTLELLCASWGDIAVWTPNVAAQRRAANHLQNGAEAQSGRSLQQPCWASRQSSCWTLGCAGPLHDVTMNVAAAFATESLDNNFPSSSNSRGSRFPNLALPQTSHHVSSVKICCSTGERAESREVSS